MTTPSKGGFTQHGLDNLTRGLSRFVENGRVPGVVALLARGGEISYSTAIGLRDPADASRALRANDIFRIYSMTKPVVSVAIMRMVEQGLFNLTTPLAEFIPAFADMQVLEGDTLVPARSLITIHDLLRHTSGLTYEFSGTSAVHKRYMAEKIYRTSQTSAEQVATLASLPLIAHPGTAWDYSRSTDVLGRVLEIVSGQSLGDHLKDTIFTPLGMEDTGFWVPEAKQSRIAEPFSHDPVTGEAQRLLNLRSAPSYESGGGGLASTAQDYFRFASMLASGGTLKGVPILGRKTLDFMRANHLTADMPLRSDLLPPGHGFGLGFAVRTQAGVAPSAGSVGEYFWLGIAGTIFWIDPQEDLIAIALIQGPGQREYFRVMFRNLVYAAL